MGRWRFEVWWLVFLWMLALVGLEQTVTGGGR